MRVRASVTRLEMVSPERVDLVFFSNRLCGPQEAFVGLDHRHKVRGCDAQGCAGVRDLAPAGGEQVQQERRHLPEPAILSTDGQSPDGTCGCFARREDALGNHGRNLGGICLHRPAESAGDAHSHASDCAAFVFDLVAGFISVCFETRGFVDDPDGRGDLIASLAAGPGGFVGVHVALSQERLVVQCKVVLITRHAFHDRNPGPE